MDDTVTHKQIDARGLLKQVAVVAGGAVVAQGINFLAALALTRLYTPTDFGLFGTYSAIVTLGAVASGLRYELAVPLPKREGTAANLLALAAVCVIAVASAILFVVVLLGLPGLLDKLMLVNYLYALPLGIAAAGLYQAITYWSMRHYDFRGIAKSRIGQSSSGAAAQIAFSWVGAGAAGLIAGSILSHLVGMALLTLDAWAGKRATWRQVRWSRMRWLAIRFNRFPKFSVFEGLAAAAGTQLPILVFAASFSSTSAGQFVLAVQVAQAPLRLLGSAMGQVLLSRAAEARRTGNLAELMTSSLRMLARLGIAPLLMAAAIAPELFSLAFGEKWRIAGMYATWLMPILAVEFLFAPLSVVAAASEQQLGALLTRVPLVGIPMTVMYAVAMMTGEPLMAITSYSATGCIAYLAYGTWLMYVSGVSAQTWIRILALEFLMALLPFMSLLGLKLMIGPAPLSGLVVGIGLTGICSWCYLSARKMFA